MGADFLHARARAPQVATGPSEHDLPTQEVQLAIAFARIDALDAAVLDDLADCYVLDPETVAVSELGGIAVEEASACDLARAVLRTGARLSIYNSRDLAFDQIAGNWYVLTGGLSTGDAPTDAFKPILAIDEVGLWDTPITPEDIARASLNAPRPD